MPKGQPIRAAEIVGSPVQYAGTINVEKCIKYLRGIGVDVDDATGDSWLTTQSVHRFLRRMKGPVLVFWVHHCSCGEMEGISVDGEKARRWRNKRQREAGEESPTRCENCGTGLGASMSRMYEVARDGTERDFRSPEDRVIPFDWREFLADGA